MSLRLRLLLAVVALVAVGLSLVAVGIQAAVSNYLCGRLDQQVREAHPLVEQALVHPGSRDHDRDDADQRFGSVYLVGTYGALYDAGGHRLAETSPGLGDDGRAAPGRRPEVTPQVLATAPVHPKLATVALETVPADNHSGRFRLLGERFTDGRVLVVAVPYTQVDNTLRSVRRIEIVASAVGMAVLAALTYVLIRFGLRPLTRIELTADQIARGDLTRRVDNVDRRTEVGRLGYAFNAMLTRIEAAFQAQERSEGRLRQFVGDASHELRTPLTSIRGYAEMFHRGAASRPADLAMVMRRIEEESARMSGLVDDMLQLARLDQGPVLDRQPVDLAAVVRDVVADTLVTWPGRTIEAHPPPILEVSGDAGRLQEAVGNLVRNAVVHTPAATSITVVVETAASGAGSPSGGEGEFVVSVIDRGPGVAPGDVPHLFERFYRADPGRSRDAGGSGLGLSIARAVAQAHGGRVEYRPTPGGGATFRLVLPAGPARPPAADRPATPAG
ncbi:HAMP domain-containing sensor histidine kinase [Frankia sp. AgB32]|uniref:sensor histidine kinase n=1 Tax=Frankia sp. AgB32 TaxID=631119 RepID=UPI00200ED161|nr:HAMP domain-containing sensor histidine kinase [Frankia sp. AgB32]